MTSIILYDLPSRQGTAWSLNPWKTRMVLNFKGLEYNTEWTSYADLEPKFSSFGITPNDPQEPGYAAPYTSPVVCFIDGERKQYVMDSWKIVQEIERRYPTPSLRLDDPINIQIRDTIGPTLLPLRAVIIPKVPRNLLNERCRDHFERTRKEKLGRSLAEFETEAGGEEAWRKADAPASAMAQQLKKHRAPFFLGSEVCYADFILVAALHMIRRIDGQVFQRYLAFDPRFSEIYEASQQWLVKED